MHAPGTLPSRPAHPALPRLTGPFVNAETRWSEARRLAREWTVMYRPHFGRAQRRAYIDAMASVLVDEYRARR